MTGDPTKSGHTPVPPPYDPNNPPPKSILELAAEKAEAQARAAQVDEDVTEDVPPSVLDVPAFFANNYYVVTDTKFTRIAFGEILEGQDTPYRTAVVLPAEDAEALAALIVRLIAQAKREKK